MVWSASVTGIVCGCDGVWVGLCVGGWCVGGIVCGCDDVWVGWYVAGMVCTYLLYNFLN